MYTVRFSLIAQRIIIDRKTNSISIIDVVETIQSQQFPVLTQKLECLFFMSRDEDDSTSRNLSIRISIGESVIAEVPGAVDFQDRTTNRFVITLNGMPIPEPGNLKISLIDESGILGTSIIKVQKLSVPEVEIVANSQST